MKAGCGTSTQETSLTSPAMTLIPPSAASCGAHKQMESKCRRKSEAYSSASGNCQHIATRTTAHAFISGCVSNQLRVADGRDVS
ncbi:hypothetical protein E2C01_036709 [Portunus trituberculatus]|uniref:Uncharacterized protein n=1 Tax=Portunus trituberculatus TaxID=210409 RepID=A0A5B7F9E5_PORTR|nr:hypothetical protein [Portunus trituberculatus]